MLGGARGSAATWLTDYAKYWTSTLRLSVVAMCARPQSVAFRG
jgi:hypothetical protein